MGGTLLAVISAVGFGVGQFLIQAGLRGGRAGTFQGLFINLLAANATLVVALVVVLLTSSPVIDPVAVLYFAAAGLMAPLFGRGSNFIAIRRIGATRTASFGMTESIFAAAIAYAVLDQNLSLESILGILLLVVGMVLFINESGRTFQAAAEVDRARVARQPARQVWLGVMFALLSGLFFAVAGLFRSLGLELMPSAVVGAAIGTFAALLVALTDLLRRRQLRRSLQVERRDALPLAGSGIAASLAMLAFFLSLRVGVPLAISTALKNTTPLVTFGLAAVFMARRERVSLRLGLLVALVVVGGTLTALGRG